MFLRVLENNLPEVPKRDKIKHAVEKQAAAKQTFVFHACFNEKADLRSKSRKLQSSELSSLQ